jgi:dTDP-4-dehydrorhamnose reductase
LDITQRDQVLDVMEKVKPDVVINTAAMTNVDQCETDRQGCSDANVTAVEYLIEACQKNKTHLIQLSTDFIFDGSEGPLMENATPNPVNFYGESKLQAERLIQESEVSWTILRTVLVYGVTQDMSRSNIVLWVRKSLLEGKSIQVVNDQWRTPTLAEDLAHACYLAAVTRTPGVFHVSGKEMMTPYDIAIETASAFGLNKSLISPTDSTKFKQTALRPLRTGFNIEKAKRDLGYVPHSFMEGLQVIADQLKNLQ